MKKLRISTAIAIGLMGIWSGCSCEETPIEPIDDRDTLPVGGNGNGDGLDPDQFVFKYEGDLPLELYREAQYEMPFSLHTTQGEPVSGKTVLFSVEGNGSLAATQSATNTSGRVSVLYTAGSVDGDATVTASVDGLPAVRVPVRVTTNPFASLRLRVEENSQINVVKADVKVYAMNPSSALDCDAIANTQLAPTPVLAPEYSTVPSSQVFNDLPGATVLTIVGTGYNATGETVATGCSDAGSLVAGTTADVTLVLEQLPSEIAGDYDVHMGVGLVGALPEPYEEYVSMVSSAFADPVGRVLYEALYQLDTQTDCWLTNFVTDGNCDPIDYEEVISNPDDYWVYDLGRSQLEDLISDRLGDDYEQVKNMGEDIDTLLKGFEVGAHLKMEATNDPNTFEVTEQWNDIVFQWQYNCPLGDLGCARRVFEIENTSHAPIEATYSAAVTRASNDEYDERYEVVSEPHHLGLKYGAIALVAIEQVVFPNLPERVRDDNLEGVLRKLIGCEEGNVTIAAAALADLCGVGTSVAGNIFENTLLNMRLGGDAELDPVDANGALGGGTFTLTDKNEDLKTESVDDFQYKLGWNQPSNPELVEEIAGDITGKGRRSASHCGADSDCEVGNTCQAIPHYLGVQAVEMDCKVAQGSKLGEEPCSSNAQCGTGQCLSSGSCFSACQSDEQCGGSCEADVASLNLDGSLEGLGDALYASCVP